MMTLQMQKLMHRKIRKRSDETREEPLTKRKELREKLREIKGYLTELPMEGEGEINGEMLNEPLTKRHGRLKNGNPPGDPSTAPRCRAKTRRKTQCQAPGMRRNGRCRMHGGTSTGPKTEEGLRNSRRANWKHGWCSKIAMVIRRGAISRYPHLYQRYFPLEWLKRRK